MPSPKSRPVPCPDRGTLEKLLAGQLPEAELIGLESHILECTSCGDTIGEIKSQDPLFDAMRGARLQSERPDASLIDRMLDKVRAEILPGGSPRTVTAEGAAEATVVVDCPKCGKKLRVKQSLTGKRVKCPACGETVAVSPSSTDTQDLSATIDRPKPAGESTHDGSPTAGRQDALQCLAPAQAPGELGRLGNYRVKKVLGAGGMGVVFLADDPDLERSVAIKAMLPAIAASETARSRFLREAKSAAKIEHEHIIAIFLVSEDRGVPFVVMPYLKGRALDAHLKATPGKPLAADEIARIGREIAEGLDAAHQHGLIHRDIKPGNIWLEGDKRKVKILDFGLARAAADTDNLTQSGAIVGTPAYMAPEQARGQEIDARADLFSLGCLLYEMSTGHRPFRGKDTMAILSSLALDDPTPPCEVNPAISPALSAIVMKLLAKDPTNRFAGARETAEALAVRVPPAALPPVPPTSITRTQPAAARPAPAARRRLWMWLALALVILAPLAWLAFGYILRIETESGTLVVEVKDDDVEVAVQRGEAVVQPRSPGREFRIKAGKGEVHVYEKNSPVKLVTREFTLTQGDRTIVRVSMEDLAPARADRKAAEWVQSVGGTVFIHHEKTDDAELGPADALPDEAFMLVGVGLHTCKNADPDGLRNLAGSRVGSLWVTETKDLAELRHLDKLPQLCVLGLVRNGPKSLTAEAVDRIASLENLTDLHLQQLVDDADFGKLARLKKLRNFANFTSCYDAKHLEAIAHMPLRKLVLAGPVEDKNLAKLGSLKQLRYFEASGRVNDAFAALKDSPIGCIEFWGLDNAGLQRIAGLRSLRVLSAEQSTITDDGLMALAGHPSLSGLRVTKSPFFKSAGVTPGGVTRLLDTLENCGIVTAAVDESKGAFKGETLSPYQQRNLERQLVPFDGGWKAVRQEQDGKVQQPSRQVVVQGTEFWMNCLPDARPATSVAPSRRIASSTISPSASSSAARARMERKPSSAAPCESWARR